MRAWSDAEGDKYLALIEQNSCGASTVSDSLQGIMLPVHSTRWQADPSMIPNGDLDLGNYLDPAMGFLDKQGSRIWASVAVVNECLGCEHYYQDRLFTRSGDVYLGGPWTVEPTPYFTLQEVLGATVRAPKAEKKCDSAPLLPLVSNQSLAARLCTILWRQPYQQPTNLLGDGDTFKLMPTPFGIKLPGPVYKRIPTPFGIKLPGPVYKRIPTPYSVQLSTGTAVITVSLVKGSWLVTRVQSHVSVSPATVPTATLVSTPAPRSVQVVISTSLNISQPMAVLSSYADRFYCMVNLPTTAPSSPLEFKFQQIGQSGDYYEDSYPAGQAPTAIKYAYIYGPLQPGKWRCLVLLNNQLLGTAAFSVTSNEPPSVSATSRPSHASTPPAPTLPSIATPRMLTLNTSFNSSVRIGGLQQIAVHTIPGASVNIMVTYPDGSTINQGPGLANPTGSFVDAWYVSPSAVTGTARAVITVTSVSITKSVSISFQITL